MSDPKNDHDRPSIGYIYEHWLTSNQAAELLNMTRQGVHYLCKIGKLRATKIGTRVGGELRIDPDSVYRYHRRKLSGNP
jgi:hypothetical protein